MTDAVLYGVAVQENEFADEHVIASSYDHEKALNALREASFSRRYLVEHTADGWVEAQPAHGPVTAGLEATVNHPLQRRNPALDGGVLPRSEPADGPELPALAKTVPHHGRGGRRPPRWG